MSNVERLLWAILGNSADGMTAKIAHVQMSLKWIDEELDAAIADAQKRGLVDYATGDPLIHLSLAGKATLKIFKPLDP